MTHPYRAAPEGGHEAGRGPEGPSLSLLAPLVALWALSLLRLGLALGAGEPLSFEPAFALVLGVLLTGWLGRRAASALGRRFR